MLRPGSLIIVVVLAGQVLPVWAQETLEWKWKKGDQFFLRTVSSFKQTWKTQGKETKQEIELTTVLGFKVEDKTNEGWVIKQTLEELSVKTGGGGPAVEEKLKGAALTFTLSPKMEILKLEGTEQLVAKLAGEDSKVKEGLHVLLTDEALKKSVREALAFLPDRSIKQGETWERTLDVPFGPLGTLKQTNTYKLEGKEEVGGKKVDKVTMNTAVEFRVGKPAPSLPFQVISGEMKAEEAKGTLYFDTTAGQLVQLESKMTLKGRLILSISRSNVDTEVQQEQSTKVVLLKENPTKP